jgi:ABC-type transport system substrate-binding protein
VAMMKVTVPADGKALSKERAPHPIFGDVKVRKAIGCYGLDRKEIVNIAFKGKATPWVGMDPPGTLDPENVNQRCPYDPTRAKALLAEAPATGQINPSPLRSSPIRKRQCLTSLPLSFKSKWPV